MRRAAFRFAVVNLGCKVNRVEADGFERLLAGRGGAPSSQAEADLIVVNTCTVTGEAEKKTRKAVRHALSANEEAPVVVTGCATEIDAASYEALGSRVTVVPKAVMALYLEEGAFPSRLPAGGSPLDTRAQRDDHTAEEGELAAPERPAPSTGNRAAGLAAPEGAEAVLPADGRTRIGIKVQDGCNQFCTYCVIPYARGRVRSRDKASVVEEVRSLVKNGYQEVVLTGIHLSSYGIDFKETKEDLLSLILAVNEVEGLKRIRLGSLEPRIITEEFVRTISGLEKICPHFHLSLQSGCDETLKRMNRRYTSDEYYEKCSLLRKYFDKPALTTDVIVGFPGETEEEFEKSRIFVEKVSFYETHIFKYSKREGTKAASMEHQVPEQIKTERSAVMLELSKRKQREYEENFIGKSVEVLVEEEIIKDGRRYQTGHTREYMKVAIEGDKSLQNELLSVKIENHLQIIH